MYCKSAKFAFLSLCFITSFLACNKTHKKSDQLLIPEGKTGFSISVARTWFEQEVKTNTTQANNRSRPNMYFNVPDWDNAVFETGANRIGYWKIPLNSEDKIRRMLTVYDKGKKKAQVDMPNPWLLIYQDRAHITRMLVMQAMPDSLKTTRSLGFGGEVKMYDWSGRLEVGFVYVNGKKEQQITPSTSNRRRTGDPNARWEFTCINYIDCEFQSQCTGTNSGVFVVTVAFAVVRDQTSCSYPYDDPYASALNADPGAIWNCEGWVQTNTTPVSVCEDIWIDDIPEPEPYVPDPTVISEGYGIQDITNDLTNPCQRAVATSIMDYRGASEIVKAAKEIFGVSVKMNLIFKPQSDFFTTYPTTPWPSNVAARHGGVTANGIRTSTIYLNDSLLANASQEYIAASILHEILHAILTIDQGSSESYQHNEMAMSYLAGSNALLMDMYSLSEGDAQALNVDGLRNTILGSTIYNCLPTQWNSLVTTATQYRDGIKGTACP